MNDELLTFRATLPPVASAFGMHGQEGDVRIKLDIPASDADAAYALFKAMAGRSFRVVIVRDETAGPA